MIHGPDMPARSGLDPLDDDEALALTPDELATLQRLFHSSPRWFRSATRRLLRAPPVARNEPGGVTTNWSRAEVLAALDMGLES